ncbi:putative membrane-associated protein [Methanocella conradii HZ254]|uniref:Membrane-associated protein n=1 Tax=Methanocella conradii (strain DSM 24694 / JCM 17849 / CGMCC 1.5162 / HZ254) TaxID=1041930 RepID=H8I670_METCZ|nr:DedA family protein [Methanocella conradii]AFD00717.1 putative membrane-associated protein [Methanocella conradii HZ254]MDI6896415.1 DedA family protein [Methanocella conradii]
MVLFELVSTYITDFISAIGYVGIFILMTLESACMPVPSEIVMPFSGFAVQRGELNFFLVGLAGSMGCLAGSVLSYVVGYYGGRPLLEKYGKYVLINEHEIRMADRWFNRYGDKVVFIARLLPIVRTFISLPAGVARMDFKKFSVYSFVGSVPWCFALAYAGVVLGESWTMLEGYWIYFDIATMLGVAGVLAYFGYKVFVKNGVLDAILRARN